MSRPLATFTGPPADRMTGRAQAKAARMAARKPKGNYTPKQPQAKAAPQQRVSAATEARANSFLAREELLDRAIASGVISAGMRGHYARAYDADDEGCRVFLAKLPGGAAIAATTVVPGEDDGLALLTNAERQRVADARAGRRPTFVHGG